MNSYWIPIERDIAVLLAMKMGDPFSVGQIRDTIRLIIVIPSGAKTGWLRKTFS
ncbi:hypothetical protein FORC37_2957 [Vibrio vulnificus]|nr:hypothetical protein FORC17_3039 [Vibrio vulnificus]ASC58651.1 hypothetical protein FORC37_2957 [Vibrio vulnificus]QBH30140.1 hypothetical protein FORC77_4417 [Vibrio vulnificus]